MHTRTAAIAALIALAFAACGGGGSKTSTAKTSTAKTSATTSSPTTASTSKSSHTLPADGCALLSAEQVATVLPSAGPGKATAEGTAGLVSCTWDSPTGQLTVRITDLGKLGVTSAPPLIIAGGRDEQDVAGIGDGAKIAKVGPGADLIANVGQIQIGIDLILLGAWPAVKDPMVGLAKVVVAKI